MLQLFYTIYISVDLVNHEVFRAKVGISRVRSSAEQVFFLTTMLVTLNIVFMICVSPKVIYIIGQYT